MMISSLGLKASLPPQRNWYRNRKLQQPEKIIDRAGRQHVKQVVEQVSKSYSSVTSAIGRSARSQLPAIPSSTSTVPSKRGREETLTSDQQGDKRRPTAFQIDPDNFDLQEYKFNDVDVGNLFLDFQRRSTGLVNRPQESASLFNIHSFLAMNYIWDMACLQLLYYATPVR
ncbi:MAG: hypothetical protein J3Q66DRAFT_149758 [Benniella sp.]|nr:MAG: hypothetical protein J3Q66DRAFT_149758 [Benniella sp.]